MTIMRTQSTSVDTRLWNFLCISIKKVKFQKLLDLKCHDTIKSEILSHIWIGAWDIIDNIPYKNKVGPEDILKHLMNADESPEKNSGSRVSQRKT